jgi:3-phenylpropionate/cinnamic acid dioxygenase small subunit
LGRGAVVTDIAPHHQCANPQRCPSVEDAQDVEVACKFLINRNRTADTEDTLIGKRVDRLRRNGESWLIYKRTVYINQSVLRSNSLSFFV